MSNLRHRRRANTHTIQRKKTAQIQRRPAPDKPNLFLTFIKIVIIVGIIALGAYAGYKYGLPIIQQKLPSIHFVSKQKQPKVAPQQKPALPIEQTKETPRDNMSAGQEKEKDTEVYVRATQVEILNGCGQSGIAKVLAEKLKAHKYDVVNTGNYLKGGRQYFNVKKSRIIDQLNTAESRKKTKKLAKILGISEKQIQWFSNPNPIADITIIIGKDYKKLSIFKGKK